MLDVCVQIPKFKDIFLKKNSENLFGGFWDIARNPSDGFGRKWVEIVPTGLPELSKPFRDLLNLRKAQLFTIKMFGTPNFSS